MLKRCSSCKKEKPTEEFHKNQSMRDGFQNQCKLCKGKVNNLYLRLNSVKRKETLDNYYLRNKLVLLEKGRIYREENKEKRRQTVLRWDRNNPEKLREKQRRRRARKYDQLGEVSPNIENKLWDVQQGLCHYCECYLEEYHLEHKTPLCRGGLHDDSNLVLSCPGCNRAKGRKTEEEFMGSVT